MIALADAETIRRSNLAIALFCLPAERRRHALTFYRFCRAVDDLADEDSRPPSERMRALAGWKRCLESGKGIPPELDKTITACGVDRQLLVEITLGCERDVESLPMANTRELQGYCWQVACAVGLASIQIFGCRNPASKDYAEQLGHALQLTNILRDVKEDASMGRVYLPDDMLARHGINRELVLRGQNNPRLRAVLADLASLATSHYATADALLPKEDARALLPARIMSAIYGGILRKIIRQEFDVFSRRIRLSATHKALLFVRVFLSGKLFAR